MAKRLRFPMLIVILGTIAASVIYTAAYQDDAPKILSDAELMATARAYANQLGLIGDPLEEKGVVTTLGSYMTLTGQMATSEQLAYTGLTRDMPVFVYQVRGDIPSFFFYPEQGRMEYIMLQLDAVTGEMSGFSPVGFGQAPYDLDHIPADTSDQDIPDFGYEPQLPPDIAERLEK